jgi:hypothetical protein
MSKDDIQMAPAAIEPSNLPAEVGDLKDLSAEDRKLAELGYVPVRRSNRCWGEVHAHGTLFRQPGF